MLLHPFKSLRHNGFSVILCYRILTSFTLFYPVCWKICWKEKTRRSPDVSM